MEFLINDRTLLVVERLKLLVLAPEIIARGADKELGVTFRFVDPVGAEKELSSGSGMDISRLAVSAGTIPFSASEVELGELGVGEFRIDALLGARSIGGQELTVADQATQDAILARVRSEKLRRREPVLSALDLSSAWQLSWERLFQFLGVPTPRHITVRTAQAGSTV